MKLYDFTQKENNLNYLVEQILNQSIGMFQWTGLPDTIPQRQLEYQLQNYGFSFVCEVPTGVNSNVGDLYAFKGGLGGEQDAYERDTTITISNPYLQFNKTLVVLDDKDGVLVRNDALKMGFSKIIQKWGTLMVEGEASMNLSTINSRLQWLVRASDTKTVIEGNAFIERIKNGELSVLTSSILLDNDSVKTLGGVGSEKTGMSIIQGYQYAYSSLMIILGINTTKVMKSERMLKDEISDGDDAAKPYIQQCLETRIEYADRLNKRFGLNVSVDFSEIWKDIRNYNEDDNEVFSEVLKDIRNYNKTNPMNQPDISNESITAETGSGFSDGISVETSDEYENATDDEPVVSNGEEGSTTDALGTTEGSTNTGKLELSDDDNTDGSGRYTAVTDDSSEEEKTINGNDERA